ncbi:MAG TPA: inorganic diphosphatase [Abditibacteriaceae bacterium]|jgi:inorganic pyrophosphatase
MHFIAFDKLASYDPETGDINAVIETPKGSHNKYDYDAKQGFFKLSGVLAAGASFPYDFGFVPSTLGEDGDPLDILVLMDEAAFSGCVVPARLIGVIEAQQTERDGATMRNDRLVAVAAHSRQHQDVRSLDDLNSTLIEEIEHFFISYNAIKGKQFEPQQRADRARAEELIRVGQSAFAQQK